MSATATQPKPYEAKAYPSEGFNGISKEQLEQHFKLYQGYVTNTNTLNTRLFDMLSKGEVGTPEYNEMKRRFGFEYSGMRLHEFYFGNLQTGGNVALPKDTALFRKIEEDFGSFENWEKDFRATGLMRGIGWAVLYQDPVSKRLQNFWIGDHENGHPAGFNAILVMDVWEHAFTVDFKPTEKAKYIEAFFANINWQAAEARLLG
jgi:superoxide dismutase, Fe-Mn family